ncbi:MAG TPA: hypothetical protein VHT27_13120 [Solirubrobacteraceae bacterium]|jgi:hypothetical protein|nr:hypothetical protein [Solirubrobacteraceae bacterium]
MKCFSYEFCGQAALPEKKFCKAHDEILTRVRYELASSTQKQNLAKPEPAEMTITKPRFVSVEERKQQILSVLAKQELPTTDLFKACNGTASTDRLVRARNELLEEGKIRRRTGKGAERIYKLV